jgi:hypothetical protein
MGSSPFSEISCALCGKPVDLSADLSADEKGKAVHAHCYINHLAKAKPAGIWQNLRLRWQRSKFGLEDLPD